ncbi:MAG: hypothetical protein V1781_06855 [Bacteroidota bacterium]
MSRPETSSGLFWETSLRVNEMSEAISIKFRLLPASCLAVAMTKPISGTAHNLDAVYFFLIAMRK